MSPFFIWETLTMRRKDREVKELSEITRIIDSSDCCRLGLVDKGKAYIVPMNFGYEVIGGEIVLYRKTAVKLPPFKVEDVRLKNECLNCYKSL